MNLFPSSHLWVPFTSWPRYLLYHAILVHHTVSLGLESVRTGRCAAVRRGEAVGMDVSALARAPSSDADPEGTSWRGRRI